MKKIIFSLFAIYMLSGCASIIKGKTKDINVLTSTGEEVVVDVVSASGTQTVRIPGVVNVKRDNRPVTIMVKNSTYIRPSTTVVPEKVELWTFGNLIFGGVFGTTTDASTGAMWDYDDSVVVPVYLKSGYVYR
ncbi:MAG: adenosine deaminase [Alphaproteobacteria bacterium]|nr:adenosine deaminase [Alphaproteobacteria bacterium]